MLKKLMGATGLGVVFAATAGLGAQAQVVLPDLGPATTEECLSFTIQRFEADGVTPVLDEFNNPVFSQSFECGPDADATNYDATAVGGSAKAAGEGSTAFGKNAQATGDFSSAIGHNTQATGDGAVALGNGSLAAGANSLASGPGSEANGDRSVAIGEDVVINGDDSMGVGQNITVEEDIAIANALAGTSWLQANETHAVTANWGYYGSTNAFAFTATQRIDQNWSVNGGIGFSTDEGEVGARAGVRLGW